MNRMPRTTWLVVGGIGVLLVVAGIDAVRSPGSEDAGAESEKTNTTETRAQPTPAPTGEDTLSARQEIEGAGNEWARLYASGNRRFAALGTCIYMTQPACERTACEHVGGRPIRNCTPPTWAYRRSFADAKITAIVIEGRHAGVRFSNDETVLFLDVGQAWQIAYVGIKRLQAEHCRRIVEEEIGCPVLRHGLEQLRP